MINALGKDKIIPRPDYLADLDRHREASDLIKIISGVRRCGKSTLLLMYQNELRVQGVNEKQIHTINFEDFTNRSLLDGEKLHKFVETGIIKNKMNYIFLDEVQLVYGFGEIINSLRLRKNIDLYVTGSNSSLLSKKLPKILGGRYIQIHMLPLSFKEYVSAINSLPVSLKKENASLRGPGLDLLFQYYLENSSFPEALAYFARGDQQGTREYLAHIYESIILRDVMQQDDVKELPQLTRVVNFLFSNIGSESSINSMINVINNEFRLKQNDKNLYAPLLERYLEALLGCFIFYKAEKQYIGGRELLRTNAKYYAVDAGLRYYLLGGTARTDAGHLLENIVYLELLRRGYKVNFGKLGDKEIDFMAQKPGGHIEYYQVSQSIMDQNTLQRELGTLQAIKDNYPKFLLTRDYNNDNYNGIQHVNVLEWLLGS